MNYKDYLASQQQQSSQPPVDPKKNARKTAIMRRLSMKKQLPSPESK